MLAMDCLNHRSKPEVLDRGLQLAVTHAEFVRGTIQQSIDLGQIVNSGPFLYAQVRLVVVVVGAVVVAVLVDAFLWTFSCDCCCIGCCIGNFVVVVEVVLIVEVL